MWQYVFLYLLPKNTTLTNIIYQRRHGIKVNKFYDAGVTYKNNKNVDIKFSAHDAFLEQLSSYCAHHEKIGMPNNYQKLFGRQNTRKDLNRIPKIS
jgi:hypothetical protein